MNSTLPKFRTDLTIRAQDTNSGRYFIVKDTISGQFFRLREVEEFISRQLDGETTFDVVRARVRDKFEAELEPQTLRTFAEHLRFSGLLEGSNASSGHRGRIRGSLLYLRFKILDPTWIFDRVSPWIRFLFTPYFLAFSGVSILFAAALARINQGDVLQGFVRLWQPSSIPLLVAFSFITVGFHEFAHGLTCRYFGGAVDEIGFLLVYFQPALYCNVSDAWLFPEKSKRLWVAFAGPFFELFLWSFAVLVWRATEADNFINQCALAVVAISGVKTLFNFNPLIKLDGYYMLSDFLEIPNLRQNSFRRLGNLLRGFAGKKVPPEEGVTQREGRIYLFYGLIAAVGSFALLGGLFVSVLKYFGEGNRSALVMLPLVSGLFFRLRQWFFRLFSRSAKLGVAPDEEDAEFGSAATTPASKAAVPEKPNKSRLIGRWLWRAAWIGAAAMALAVIAKKPVPLRVSGPFNILPGESADVRVTVDGLIEKLYVHEGDRVEAGSLIATLSDRDLRANLESTDAQIREVRAKLRMLQLGAPAHEIAVAEAAVNKTADHIQFAKKKVDRAKALLAKGLVARSAYDDAEEQFRATESELAEAKARLTALIRNVRPEQVDEIAAQIDRLETDRHLIQRQLGSLRVLSPAAGVVGTPERQLLQMVHQFAGKGSPIAKIYNSTSVKAQIVVSEKEISEVQLGQPVKLRARAFPQTTFQGKVTFISTSAAGTPTGADPVNSASTAGKIGKDLNIVFVYTDIDNQSSLLKPELTGEAMIDCGQKRLADLLLWRLNRYLRVDFFWW